MSVDISTSGLNREYLKRLRDAQTVSFHHGQYPFQCCIKLTDKAGAVLELEVGSSIQGGMQDRQRDRRRFTEAFEMIHSARFHDEWRTICYLLRAGDVLTLIWQPDHHTNSYCDEAHGTTEAGAFTGLHHDVLSLRVERPVTIKGRDTVRRLTFHIDSRLTPDNSARMIR
jgi:hypothetical protein